MLLRRHSFAMTLGLISAALRSTSLVSVSNFLQVKVNRVVHLPLAELQPLGVEVTALEKAEVQLDRRADVAVRPRVDQRDPELLDRRAHLCGLVVLGVVHENDRVVAPLRVLAVLQLAKLREEGDHHARVRDRCAEGDICGAMVVDRREEAGPRLQLLLWPHVAPARLRPRVALERRRAQPRLVDVEDALAALEDLEHLHRVVLPAEHALQPIGLRRQRLDLPEAIAELATHDEPQCRHRAVALGLLLELLSQPINREHSVLVLIPLVNQLPDRVRQLGLAALLLLAQLHEVLVLLGGPDDPPSQPGRDLMLGGDGLMTEQLDLLAVNDRADVGGDEIYQPFLCHLVRRLRVLPPPALLVLFEGLAERGGDNGLIELLEVDVLLFVLL